MKKYLTIVVIVLAITAIFASSVLAAPAQSTINLVSVSYNDGGVVLIFETSGLAKSDLKDASIFAASNWHKMYCTFIDDTTDVRCTVSRKIAGKGEFYAALAGIGFWGVLPQPQIVCSNGEVAWYSYNQYHNGVFVFSGKVPVWVWEEAETSGYFTVMENQGYTFEITGTSCGSNITVP